jgi:hypothetical protein
MLDDISDKQSQAGLHSEDYNLETFQVIRNNHMYWSLFSARNRMNRINPAEVEKVKKCPNADFC